VAGLGVGRLSDFLGRRKIILVAAAFAFSLASLGSGLATSFAMLVGARLLMGVAEGGVMPITQALVAAEVEPGRRGLAMGAAQNFGANLLGNFLAPLVLVAFASAYGWRHAFFLTALPGLIVGALMWAVIREPPVPARIQAAGTMSIGAVMRSRNVWLCSLLSILLVAFLVVFAAFMPVYLVQNLRMDKTTMAWLMSMWGLPSMLYAFLVTGTSDLIGRRPVVIAMSAVSALIPLSVLWFRGDVWPLFLMFGLGASVSGIYPLVMATIPSETVPASEVATAMGLTMGLGEVVGGVLSPEVAGLLADSWGLAAIVWVLLTISTALFLIALGLRETAPAARYGHEAAAAS
jgi:MFS family permease